MGQELLTSVIIALLGGSGLAGLLFKLFSRRVDAKLAENELRLRERNNLSLERDKVLSELRHAQGKVLFWLKKSVKDNYVNGELDKAFIHYEEVEEKLKALDRDIIARSQIGKE